MKSLKLPQWRNPPIALVSLLFLHSTFIVFLFIGAAQPRYFSFLAIGYLFCFSFEIIRRNFRDRPSDGLFIAWVPLAIANSTFVNADAQSIWAFLLALFVAMSSRVLFVDKNGRHIFNPSMIGVVFTCVFFPSYMVSSLHSFEVLWPQNIILITIGLVTVFLARTLVVCFTYQLGVFLIYGAISLYMALTGFDPNFAGIYSPSAKIVSQVTVGVLIFTFGVISDPKTAPRGFKNQVLFGLTIAGIDIFLRENSQMLSEGMSYLITQGIWAVKRDFFPASGKIPSKAPELAAVRSS